MAVQTPFEPSHVATKVTSLTQNIDPTKDVVPASASRTRSLGNPVFRPSPLHAMISLSDQEARKSLDIETEPGSDTRKSDTPNDVIVHWSSRTRSPVDSLFEADSLHPTISMPNQQAQKASHVEEDSN